MSRTEDRAIPARPAFPERERGAAGEPLETDVGMSYASLPLKPTRAVAVMVRRVAKVPPRPYQADEPG